MIADNQNNSVETQTTVAEAVAQVAQPQVAQPQVQQTFQQTQQQTPTPKGNTMSLTERFNRNGVGSGMSDGSGKLLAALTEVAEQALKDQDLTTKVELIRFEASQNQVALSATLVAQSYRDTSGDNVVVFPIVINSKQPLRNRTYKHGLVNVDVPTYAQDVYSEHYVTRITSFLKQRFNNPSLTVRIAGQVVVPADVENKDTLRELLLSIANRIDDTIARARGEAPLNAAELKNLPGQLTSRFDFTRLPSYDLLGQPVRKDIMITTSITDTNKQNAADNFVEISDELNSLGVIVNLEYAPAQQQAVNAWGVVQQQQEQYLFTPSLIISDVAQASWLKANTPELYFLTMAGVFRATANNSWITALMPSLGNNHILNDIGAIGYLTAANAKIETKSDVFTPADFATLAATYIRPLPSFMIDIDPMGLNSSVERLILGAMSTDEPTRQAAEQAIFAALNNLTGNRFQSKFPVGSGRLFTPATQVLKGTYLDVNGDRRDIRDYTDTLAVLNSTNGVTKEFMEFYQTTCDDSTPIEVRLQKQRDLLPLIAGNTVSITGRYQRGYINPKLIEALDAALGECELRVAIENVSTLSNNRFTGNAMVNQFAVSYAAKPYVHVTGGVGNNAGLNNAMFGGIVGLV